jgi:phospholipid/cholesterol/gamma-HCH transport system substrate-binding protein
MQQSPSNAHAAARAELKATLLIGIFVALISLSVVYLLYARGIFEETQTLVLIAEDTEGVSVGMDMTFKGFPIGRVRRIELGADGNGRIVVDIPKKDAQWLRTTSVFTLSRSLIGASSLRAFTGIPEDPALPDGAERVVLIGDATAEIPRLLGDTREIIANVARLTAAQGPISASLDHMERFTGKLAGADGAVDAILGSDAGSKKIAAALDRTNALLARVDRLVAKTDARIFGADGLADKTDVQVFGANGLLPEARATIAQLRSGLTEAQQSLRRMDALLADAQAITANAREASTDLGALRGEIDANLRKLGRMIDEVSRRWPFAGEAEIKLP